MRPRLLDLFPERIGQRIVVREDGCWEWTGWKNSDGYGYASWDGRDVGVHRIVMDLCGHTINGLDIDHLCRNRACCNPDHLEAVPHAINMDRARPNQCRRAGHDWSDPKNVYVRADGRRWCAACARADYRAKKAA